MSTWSRHSARTLRRKRSQTAFALGARTGVRRILIPPCPPPAQDDPEPAVGDGDARAPAAQGEGGQLLAQGKDLKPEVGAVAEGGDEGAEEQQKDLEHGRMRIDDGAGTSMIVAPICGEGQWNSRRGRFAC